LYNIKRMMIWSLQDRLLKIKGEYYEFSTILFV